MRQVLRPALRRAPAPSEGVGAPVVGPADALFYLDVAGQCRLGTTIYADEAALNTALGVTKSGEARSYPVHVAPGATEIITDGSFAGGGLDSWASGPAYTSNGSVAVVSNQLVASRNGAAAAYRCSRPVTLETTKAYRLTATRVGTTGSLTSAYLAAAGGGDLNASISVGAFSNGALELDFAPSVTSFFVGLNTSGAVSSVGTLTTDDYSLKECAPLAGWVQGGFSVEINATAPNGHAAVQCIACFGDDGGASGLGTRNSVRITRNTAGNIIVDVHNNASSQASLNLGNVADNAAFNVRIAVTNNRFSGSLNGGTVVTDTSGTLPPLAGMRLGRDSAIGSIAAWGGTIQSVTLWPEALADAELPNPFDAITVLGDSRAVAIADDLVTATARATSNQATGGQDFAGTLTVAQGLASYLRLRNVVLVQYRNTGETLQQCLDGLRGIIAAIGHERIYIEPMWPAITESQQAIVDGYNAALLGEFAAYSLDAEDQAAFLLDLADRPTGDGIHDDAAHQAIRAGYAKAFFGF